jgi:hypothetical protein
LWNRLAASQEAQAHDRQHHVMADTERTELIIDRAPGTSNLQMGAIRHNLWGPLLNKQVLSAAAVVRSPLQACQDGHGELPYVIRVGLGSFHVGRSAIKVMHRAGGTAMVCCSVHVQCEPI